MAAKLAILPVPYNVQSLVFMQMGRKSGSMGHVLHLFPHLSREGCLGVRIL